MGIKHTFIASRDGLDKYHNQGLPKEECFKTAEITPLKAIRANCLECANYSTNDVKECEIWYCPLYPFRSGKSGRKSNLSENQKKEIVNRFKKARELKNQL